MLARKINDYQGERNSTPHLNTNKHKLKNCFSSRRASQKHKTRKLKQVSSNFMYIIFFYKFENSRLNKFKIKIKLKHSTRFDRRWKVAALVQMRASTRASQRVAALEGAARTRGGREAERHGVLVAQLL